MRILRFMHYYRSKGAIMTICRPFQKIRESLFRKPDIVFFVDLPRLENEEYSLPANFSVKCLRSEAELTPQHLNTLFDHIGEKICRYHMEERFSQGALFWLVEVDGRLAGYVWSSEGRTIRSHYFPLTNKDAHLFDNLIFEELRGQGINPVLINYVLTELTRNGLVRAFIETNITNTPEIRSLSKTGFQKFGLARKCHVGERNFVIWSKVR